MTGVEHGLPAIAAMFAAARAKQRAAFLPYFPIGYPSYTESLDAITALAELGADGFEIGVPFSDPLADGPVIQAATQTALANGTTVRRCLDAVRDLRVRGLLQPMLLMSYLNPLLAYGPAAFVSDAKAPAQTASSFQTCQSRKPPNGQPPAAATTSRKFCFLPPQVMRRASLRWRHRHLVSFIWFQLPGLRVPAASCRPASQISLPACVRARAACPWC